MSSEIDAARKVLAWATPGPWSVVGRDADRVMGEDVTLGRVLVADAARASTRLAEADARAIVLAVNAMPALLSALEAVDDLSCGAPDMCGGAGSSKCCSVCAARPAIDRALAALREAT